MDQNSTKDETGGDRRNWRERLGVGQDLPKISDEFKPPHGEAKAADGETGAGAASGPGPGAPVARPAPMAPRYARAAPRAGNGSSSGTETHDDKSPEPPDFNTGATGPKQPWAAASQPTHKPGEADSGADEHPSSAQSSASRTQHPSHVPPAGPAAQRPAPSRGPAAYPQAAARTAAPPAAAGNDSFGERLRAQREAAEKLAQQRLAAARDRSGHAGTDALAMLAPHKAEAVPQGRPQPLRQPAAQPKPASTEQPRFTFAQEEITAAQQETAFSASPPAAGGQQHQPPSAPQATPQVEAPPQAESSSQPALYSEPEGSAAEAPEYRAEYRHEDDGMFEAEQPQFDVAPPRASAADYSAAYREFEDEFEDEPRRGSGPMLLLAMLAAVAVVSGGLIYWYQLSDSAPAAPETGDLPVVTAPEEPAKADPLPEQQPQQAAQPTTRKQIYDRIIGEETLEPERIVPTEEEPQLRQIQRPEQQPRASGTGQSEDPGAARDDSTEPLPLPLPPPPGTGVGEQGDLLVPGMANTQTASASPRPTQASSPEPAQLSLPEPEAASASQGEAAHPAASRVAEVEPASGDPSPGRTAMAQLRDTTTAEPEAPVRSSIYPELTEPLAYPNATRESPPPRDRASQPDEDPVAPLPEREVVTEPEPKIETAPEPEVAETEPETSPEVEQASDVPLPRAKPQPPVRTATRQAPQRQAAAESSSGPVQIIPADEKSSEPQAPSASAAQQPQTQATAPRRRTAGREPGLTAGPRSSFLGASAPGSNASALQQQASVAPETSPQAQPESTGGYVVQLASFRSEAEARNEYQRLVQRHPQLVGDLDSRIQEASLGQSGAFYRLGVGPVGNRTEATRLCNALIAAGEKDCLVRRN